MKNGPSQAALAGVVVQGDAGSLEEAREQRPVAEHVAKGLAKARVRLDLPSLESLLHALHQLLEHGLAALLVYREALGRRKRLRLVLDAVQPSPTPSGNGAVKTARHEEQRRRSRS
jgi:hypothetical protein